jgi:hypothetical protein
MDEFGGFSYTDYDVMEKSCNNFTAALAKRLGVDDNYPIAILNQSKLGEILAPVVHALDLVASGSYEIDEFEENPRTFLTSSLRMKKLKSSNLRR